MTIRKVLASAVASALMFTAAHSHATGIPVVDALNVVQSTITAFESVTQTMNQVEQLQTQLEQLEDAQRNSESLSSYQWDQAEQLMGGVMNTVGFVDTIAGSAGGLDAYLGQFRNLGDYQMHNCFRAQGCSQAQRRVLAGEVDRMSQDQAENNANALRALALQQEMLKQDAANLRRLQQSAQSAQGRMAAIQAGNQLASAQINQLQQIRAMLGTQQQYELMKQQADLEAEARRTAANRQMMRTSSTPRRHGDAETF